MSKCKKVTLFIFCIIVGIIVLVIHFIPKDIELEYKEGVWYKVYLDDVIDKHGNKYFFLYRKGSSNKLLINFYGGGFAYNEEMISNKHNFYIDNIKYEEFNHLVGISNYSVFSSYSVVNIPYVSGDFHVGNKGYFNGYDNFLKIMEDVKKYEGEVSEVVVSGYSAGGFASAMLSNTIFNDYFSEVENMSVIVDSSLLLSDKWSYILGSVWNSSEEVLNKVKTDNIVLDNITYLINNNERVKVMFMSSVRDKTLVKYQNYLDNRDFSSSNYLGIKYMSNLSEMVNSLLELDRTSVYIWDDSINGGLSSHTITRGSFLNKKVSNYISSVINGDLTSYGIDLLK